MVWIEASASYEALVHAPRADIFALLWNIPECGPLFPGVDRIEDLGEHRYRWVIKERRTLGTSFIGDYVAQYSARDGEEVAWNTTEGNMRTRGAWRLHGPDGRVLVRVHATTSLDAPVPRFLKAPAQLFATKETRDGLKAQLQGVKAKVECPRRP